MHGNSNINKKTKIFYSVISLRVPRSISETGNLFSS